MRRADGSETVLETKPSGVRIGPADRVIVETPGAGGYGPPGAVPPGYGSPRPGAMPGYGDLFGGGNKQGGNKPKK